MEKQKNVLKNFCLELYKIGLALKYEKKPPDENSKVSQPVSGGKVGDPKSR